MDRLMQTPSQTVGPFFAYGLTPTQYGYDLPSLFTPVLAGPQAEGEHIYLSGQVFDGAGQSVLDAIVEISQFDARGRAVATAAEAKACDFTGFGRCGTGTLPAHHFAFETVKPGAAVDAGSSGNAAEGEAPYIDVCVTLRGLLMHVFTRIYFEDETEANRRDPVLANVPEARRPTLLARRSITAAGVQYRFDIHMQGERETVFFDW
jgi:protocatechuate 3,4-dioxygenase, alpha subunit